MFRHWPLHLVAASGLLAGALAFVVEGAPLLGGAVTAASALALALPAVVESPARPTR